MAYSVLADFLPEREATRLSRLYPGMMSGPQDYCPTCGTVGTYLWLGVENRCDCATQLQLYKWYCSSNIGLTYQRLDWDDWFGDGEIRDWARDVYLANPYVEHGMGFFLWGEMGTGKTMLATLVLKDLIKRGLRCYSVVAEDLIDEFTKTWQSPEALQWYEERIKTCDVLLLDDLGKERSTLKSRNTFLNNLLRSRVQTGRTTIVTTNLDPDYLGTSYGESSLELLIEANLSKEFTGGSVRQMIRDRKNAEVLNGEVRPIK